MPKTYHFPFKAYELWLCVDLFKSLKVSVIFHFGFLSSASSNVAKRCNCKILCTWERAGGEGYLWWWNHPVTCYLPMCLVMPSLCSFLMYLPLEVLLYHLMYALWTLQVTLPMMLGDVCFMKQFGLLWSLVVL